MLSRGDHARVDDLPAKLRAAPRRFDPRALIGAPPWVPNGLLNRATVAVFNEFWYRVTPHLHGGIETISSFFHPLDGVRGWNRLYGGRGFLREDKRFTLPVAVNGDPIPSHLNKLRPRRDRFPFTVEVLRVRGLVLKNSKSLVTCSRRRTKEF